jgi:ubiquinone/menaquinone biosynthesis C-methylase UbiE
MRAVSHAILESSVLPNGPLLEVGCGGCTFLRELAEKNPRYTTLGVDRNPAALAAGRASGSGRLSLAQADLHNLPFSDRSLAIVVGLDAFDQKGVCLQTALDESRRVLIFGGVMALRVSAYAWLRGEHDRAFGTGRRYSAKEIRAALHKADFAIERLTHANLLMLLPAIAMRVAVLVRLASVDAQLSPARALAVALTAVLRAEAAMLRSVGFPAGLSLYTLARKTAD